MYYPGNIRNIVISGFNNMPRISDFRLKVGKLKDFNQVPQIYKYIKSRLYIKRII